MCDGSVNPVIDEAADGDGHKWIVTDDGVYHEGWILDYTTMEIVWADAGPLSDEEQYRLNIDNIMILGYCIGDTRIEIGNEKIKKGFKQ